MHLTRVRLLLVVALLFGLSSPPAVAQYYQRYQDLDGNDPLTPSRVLSFLNWQQSMCDGNLNYEYIDHCNGDVLVEMINEYGTPSCGYYVMVDFYDCRVLCDTLKATCHQPIVTEPGYCAVNGNACDISDPIGSGSIG